MELQLLEILVVVHVVPQIATPVQNNIMSDMLEAYCNEIKDCQLCELGKTRTNFVFGVGNSQADLLFVGEAPGYHEDIQGLPFVGQAGKLLDKLLMDIGMTRNEVYIANVLKCRPPENRNPLLDEIKTCQPYLMKQIKIINPIVIATLGNFSTKLLLNTSTGISKIHGKKFNQDGYFIFPIFHPAAALYNPATLESLKKDFQTLSMILQEAPESIPSKPEQMELF